MAAKGIHPPTLKIIIQESLPAASSKSVGNIDAIRQSTIFVAVPSAETESLGDDQIERGKFLSKHERTMT